MNDETSETLAGKPAQRRSPKWRVRLAYAVGSMVILLLAEGLATAVMIAAHDNFVKFGLLQPLVAALIALAIVMGAWVAKGNFANEQRKGVRSASSSAIAVRLWALCFVLVVGAMQLSAFIFAIRPQSIVGTDAPKSPEKKIAVEPPAATRTPPVSAKVVH